MPKQLGRESTAGTLPQQVLLNLSFCNLNTRFGNAFKLQGTSNIVVFEILYLLLICTSYLNEKLSALSENDLLTQFPQAF